MVFVAVAGGTGRIGRHIVEAIVATGKHTVVVLSRSASDSQLEAIGVKVIQVDYENHKSLVTALRGVHTVLSTLVSLDQQELGASQIALLNAAVEAGVKRFAPSEYAIVAVESDPMVLYRAKYLVAEAVAKSGLEYTQFQNGVFMNYFVSGTKGLGYLLPFKFVVDVENYTAILPGLGEDKVAFTEAKDVGRFVAASLDLPRWPKQLNMVGEKLTYNEVVAIAEKVRGRKYEVIYLTEEELQRSSEHLHTQIYTEMTKGRLGDYEVNLNTLFPEIKPTTVEELITQWWGQPVEVSGVFSAAQI